MNQLTRRGFAPLATVLALSALTPAFAQPLLPAEERRTEAFEGRPIVIISDMHFGEGAKDGADNFYQHLERFEAFLNDVVYRRNAQLIVAGDAFEMWQGEPGKIFQAYAELLSGMRDRGTIFITGNHDYGLHGLNKAASAISGLDFFAQFESELVLTRNGERMWVGHGHQFDPVNDPTSPVGKIATLITGALERKIGNSVETSEGARSTEDVLLKPFDKAKELLSIPARKFKEFRSPASNQKRQPEIYEKLHGFLRAEAFDRAAIGHTHFPGAVTIEGGTILNTGAWQGPLATYVVWRADGSAPEVRTFPGNHIVDTLVGDKYRYAEREENGRIVLKKTPLNADEAKVEKSRIGELIEGSAKELPGVIGRTGSRGILGRMRTAGERGRRR